MPFIIHHSASIIPISAFHLTSRLFTGMLGAMTSSNHSLSRRDFLKLARLGLGALALRPLSGRLAAFKSGSYALPDFPKADIIARNCTAGKIELRSHPDVNSDVVRDVYEDTLFPWLREVSAENVDFRRLNQRWVDVGEGYIYSPYLQPCRNQPNVPLTAIPEGQKGFWAEVTVPYVDLTLDNPPARSPGVRNILSWGQIPRLYYSQLMWMDQIRTTDSGVVQYRMNESVGGYGDLFWTDAAAYRPLTADDISPIDPDVDSATKKIVVNLNYQTLSCFEGNNEVFFCRVSTGAYPGETPIGTEQAVWRKVLSTHMSGGNLELGYDGAGISWTTFFNGQGVAIHGATWHNDFGFPRSHGCVNCRPEDAKWIFRWTLPTVPLTPDPVDWNDWRDGSTHVSVMETL